MKTGGINNSRDDKEHRHVEVKHDGELERNRSRKQGCVSEPRKTNDRTVKRSNSGRDEPVHKHKLITTMLSHMQKQSGELQEFGDRISAHLKASAALIRQAEQVLQSNEDIDQRRKKCWPDEYQYDYWNSKK